MQEVDRKPATTAAVPPPPFSPPPAPSAPSSAVPLDAASTLSPKAPAIEPETDGEVELLLLSGKRRRVKVSRGETVDELVGRVWSDWPADWRASDPAPASASDLRLLHLGHFLEPKSTLSGTSALSRPPSSPPSR
ncbi:hypothetical protein JCM8208_002073 [Rhodotorula glutinis]